MSDDDDTFSEVIKVRLTPEMKAQLEYLAPIFRFRGVSALVREACIPLIQQLYSQLSSSVAPPVQPLPTIFTINQIDQGKVGRSQKTKTKREARGPMDHNGPQRGPNPVQAAQHPSLLLEAGRPQIPSNPYEMDDVVAARLREAANRTTAVIRPSAPVPPGFDEDDVESLDNSEDDDQD